MKITRFDVWIADLNPRFGTEPGKTRPVLIVQTDLLNIVHSSTLICPITTNLKLDAQTLRVYIEKGVGGLDQDCQVLIDQLRAIDNKRLIKKIGRIPRKISQLVTENIKIVLELD